MIFEFYLIYFLYGLQIFVNPLLQISIDYLIKFINNRERLWKIKRVFSNILLFPLLFFPESLIYIFPENTKLEKEKRNSGNNIPENYLIFPECIITGENTKYKVSGKFI